MAKPSSDKRSYFRIKDEVLLRWEPAQEQALTETEVNAELTSINDRLGGMINVAYAESPVLAEALGLINRKIDLLVEDRQNIRHNLVKVKINLSGAGLGFAWPNPVTVGELIDVTMRLQPSNLEVTVRTDALYCDPIVGDGGGYWIRGEFIEGQELAVEQIVRHVSFRQTQRLAAKRAEEDDYDDDLDEDYEGYEDDDEEWYEDDRDEADEN